jgi:predicted nucleic acid-binding protein
MPAVFFLVPYCRIVEPTSKCSIVCRDKKDQSFLDLAHSGKADSLVSGVNTC